MNARPSPERKSALLASLDSSCEKAANIIKNADALLLCTGAGLSADSGLAVYADVARVDAYAKLGFRYNDICQPKWLHDKPELFWGFWGQCFNDYRNTPPHEGYATVERWADKYFRDTQVGESIRRAMEQRHALRYDGTEEPWGDLSDSWNPLPSVSAEPYLVKQMPSAFFAFTSNVDGHHYDWFRPWEVRECHGNTELYQCGAQYTCSPTVWRAPAKFKFEVDKTTMLAPLDRQKQMDEHLSEPEVGMQNLNSAPKIGMVKGGGRANALRYMPDPPTSVDRYSGFEKNHPTCRACGGPARPAVLMFGDYQWEDLERQNNRWEDWVDTLQEHAKRGLLVGGEVRQTRIAVLEIGAGGRVPTVRRTSETCTKGFLDVGADASLIRINPELPLADSRCFDRGGTYQHNFISIMCGGLDALRRIDASVSSTDDMEGVIKVSNDSGCVEPTDIL